MTDTPQTPQPAQTPKMSTGLRLLLVASLAMNLLVFGAVGGIAWTWKKHGGGDIAHQSEVGAMVRALERADRRAIGRQMRQDLRAAGHDKRKMRADIRALAEDLRASPFDGDAVRARFARQQAFFNDRLKLGQGLLVDRLAQMTDAERAAYADRLEDELKRRKRHRKTGD